MDRFSEVFCSIQGDNGSRSISVQPRRLFCFGFSGRDREEVDTHIHQLEPLGIAPPLRVPVLMEVSPWLLTASDVLRVQGFHTSGEVEFVIMHMLDDVYIGIGSDHGDLELEKFDVAMAKQMAPKVVGRELWRYAEIRDHWDSLELRSWVRVHGKEFLYQSSSASVLLHPDTLMDICRTRIKDSLSGTVIFSGTISCLNNLEFAEYFVAELFDPVLERSIRLSYTVEGFNRTH